MVYPSHYGPGEYGIAKPDTQPYEIIKHAISDAQNLYNIEFPSGDLQITKNNTDYNSLCIDSKLAIIRPYLQDFTASWLKKGNYILYDTSAVSDQIQACYDLGIYDFTLWDPNNKYAYEAIQNISLEN